MDLKLLSRIDDQLESSEVADLCFLCLDAVSRRSLEGIRDARELFGKLEERCLLENSSFLYQLLQTIGRQDLLRLLERNSRQQEETDASPLLSAYRVMLYRIHENLRQDEISKMKFLLDDKLGRKQTETCHTALDVFAEMEKKGFLSDTNLNELHAVLQNVNPLLASRVEQFMQDLRVPVGNQLHGTTVPSAVDMKPPRVVLPVPETQPRDVELSVFSDAEPAVIPSPLADETEDYYTLSHNPRGLCVVFNNENFPGTGLKRRLGTMQDEKSLQEVFSRLGFTVVVHNDLTAHTIHCKLQSLAKRNFVNEDALVVCVLSHGLKECVFGTDGVEVSIQDITQPFMSTEAPTLAGKPKLFFIQACQGHDLQRGCVPCPPRPAREGVQKQMRLEEDAGAVRAETVADRADFLVGMATVPDYKAFRNTTTGSIYIQELCRQLMNSAESAEQDDILSIMTRVNREVGKGEFLEHKQMPEPKYTLTKKLVLKYVCALNVSAPS